MSVSDRPVTDIVKPEGNDIVETLIKQTIIKDPSICFTNASDRPMQWMQLLQALEHPGWPFPSPLKIQMQKCDKCSKEFFSSINCRRHIRVQHRQRKLDKDSGKNRELIESFWNKLSEEEAKEIVSFKNLTVEGVLGASIIKNLASLMLGPAFYPLPQSCNRAGVALLDIIQAKPSTFPLSAQELFSILDDASEKTFLSGSALSMQKYIFDAEAGKTGLDAKNLIACTSFFLEKQLVKAWIAFKDAEALRFQKLLVEEEEAAQRKQAEFLEKKNQKKIRQKARDRKESDHFYEKVDSPRVGMSAVASGNINSLVSDTPGLDESADQFASSLEISDCLPVDEEEDSESHADLGCNYMDSGICQHVKLEQLQGKSHQTLASGRWQAPSKSYASALGLGRDSHPRGRIEVNKVPEARGIRAPTAVNTNKVRSWKPKLEKKEPKFTEPADANDQKKTQEVMIGSILVTIESYNKIQDHEVERRQSDMAPLSENNPPKRDSTEKIYRDDRIQHPANMVYPQNSVKSDDRQIIISRSCPVESLEESNNISSQNGSLAEKLKGRESLVFSSHLAKDFMAQRWKEAVTGDHVKLVLLPSPKSAGGLLEAAAQKDLRKDNNKLSILGRAENQIVNTVTVEPISSGNNSKGSFGVKRETAGLKKIYVPKLRAQTQCS